MAATNTETNTSEPNRTIPEVPEDAGNFSKGNRLYGWEKDVRHGPTYVFMHECGSRAAFYKQGKTNPTLTYYCPECDVSLPLHSSYGFEDVRVE